MEFKEFVKTMKRMCDVTGCDKCPLNALASNTVILSCFQIVLNNPEKADEIISKWESEHPLKTNAMKIKEVFGTDIKVYSLNSDTFSISIDNDRSNGIKALKAWLESEYVEV